VNDNQSGEARGPSCRRGREPEAAAETERDKIGPAGDTDCGTDCDTDEDDELSAADDDPGDDDTLPYWLYPD
jgi:hypothetical protein